MKHFLNTRAGRMLASAHGLALLGGGVAALVGGQSATWVIALLFPVVIAIAILAVAFASTDSWGAAVASAITLPWTLFVYTVALGAIVQYAPGAGYVLALLGAGALAFALRTPEGAARPHTEPMTSATARA